MHQMSACLQHYGAFRDICDKEHQESFETMKDIEVVTAITDIDLEGETIIGMFNEALWFGDSMEHSLVPPIQM